MVVLEGEDWGKRVNKLITYVSSVWRRRDRSDSRFMNKECVRRGGSKGCALVCGPFPSFLEGILRSHWSWLCYEDNALSGEFGAQVIT